MIKGSDNTREDLGDASTGLTVVLSRTPPWYNELCNGSEQQGSRCVDVSTHEQLWEIMRSVMNDILGNQHWKAMHLKETNLMKLIKLQTFEEAKKLKWASTELLKALMDLFEIQHCDGFRCFSDTAQLDRAGIKQELLADHDYVLFYLPSKHLTGGTKPIIPVVTFNNGMDNVWYLDKSLTTFATYSVPLGLFGNMPSFFMQEVLALRGRETLSALKLIVGNLFEFWDLSLEVPTHCEALTPFFTQVQHHELVGRDPQQGKGNVQPMLCLKDTSGGSAYPNFPWYETNHLRPGLLTTNYVTDPAEGATRGLQLKRVSRSQNYIVPIVSQDQYTKNKTLFASTTQRFLKAVEHTVVLGKGELLDCHKRLLLSLAMTKDFLRPPQLHNENYAQALMRFSERVNSPWSTVRLTMPNHIDREIPNPVRNEMVTLGIKLLNQNIPDPFAVAELLCGKTTKADSYLKWCTILANNESAAALAKTINMRKLKERIDENWIELQQMAKQYCRAIMGLEEDNNDPVFQQWAMLFSPEFQTPENAIKAQSMWQGMVNTLQWKERKHAAALDLKRDSVAFGGQRCKPDVKKARAFAGNAKVLMRMIKNDQIIIQKCLKTMGSAVQQDDASQRAESKFSYEGVEQLEHFLLPCAHRDKNCNLGWIKNLFHLLKEPCWINGHPTKRDAVCTLLDVQNTILTVKNASIFRQWTLDHHLELDNYFERIQYSKRDILSAALEDSLCAIKSTWYNQSPVNIALCTKVQHQNSGGEPVKGYKLNDIVTRLWLKIEADNAHNGCSDYKRVRQDSKLEVNRDSKRAKYSAHVEPSDKAYEAEGPKAEERYPWVKYRSPHEELLHYCREDAATKGSRLNSRNRKAHKPEKRSIVGGDGYHNKSSKKLSRRAEFYEDDLGTRATGYETDQTWPEGGLTCDGQSGQELWQI